MARFKIISCISASPFSLILLKTLFFKFTAALKSVYIFTQLFVEPFGRIGIGLSELIASILLIITKRRFLESPVSVGLMIGAVILPLTKLGFKGINDVGYLFVLCITVLTCSFIYLLRKETTNIISKRVFTSQ